MTDLSSIGNTALIVSMVFAAATINDKRITIAFSLIFLLEAFNQLEQSND